MASKGPRGNINLYCTECTNAKPENYTTSKNNRNNTERLVLNKYCNTCKKHTEHKEKK